MYFERKLNYNFGIILNIESLYLIRVIISLLNNTLKMLRKFNKNQKKF